MSDNRDITNPVHTLESGQDAAVSLDRQPLETSASV
jgi:hypothetical protein